jgi:putative sugar O-methyltransferase
MEEEIFINIQADLNYMSNFGKKNVNSLWGNRTTKWKNKFVDSKGLLRKDTIKNFRAYSTLITEIPSKKENFFYNLIYQIIRSKGQKKHAEDVLTKILNNNHEKTLLETEFNLVGSPNYFSFKNQKYNERFLRHIRNLDLINEHVSKKIDKEIKNVIDIGGGYCQFASLLKTKYDSIKVATVDFPEQLLLGYYFLKKTFPNLKINTLSSIWEAEIIDKNYFEKYDLLLIPVDCFNKIDPSLFDMLTNFSSFGEMSKGVFNSYLENEIFNNIKCFFTINRIDSWPTYSNNLNVTNYSLEKFNKIHFDVSPIWDYYYVSNMPILKPEKRRFLSRNFEFIGYNASFN